jgi:ribosome maturation protein SDO1
MSSNPPKSYIAKYKHEGEEFELFVNPDKAYDFMVGKITNPMTALESDEVFKDAKKGERQSEDKVKKAFGTNDIYKIAEIILKKGDVPITTEHREKMIEEKRKQIVDIIARNSIDPRTNAPTPVLRIENAFREARVTVDPFKNAQEQVEAVVKKLSPIIPIKFATIKIDVTIPAEYANRSFTMLKQYGMKSDKWLGDGSLSASLEFPAGLQGEFYTKLNNATQGKATTKVIGTQ